MNTEIFKNESIELLFEMDTAKLISLMCKGQKTCSNNGMQTILTSLAGFNSGSFYLYNRSRSNIAKSLMLKSINSANNLITIHYTEEKTGLDFYNYLELIKDSSIVRSYVKVQNNTDKEQVLTYVSSICMNGIFSQDPRSVFEDESIIIHVCHQQWHGEGQWKEYTPSELGFYKASDLFCGSSVKISSIGSWSTGKVAPTLIIENTKTNQVCFSSIESASNYEIEFGYAGCYENGSPYITANSANENNGGFAKRLRPGDSYKSDYAIVGIKFGDFNSAIEEMTKYRRYLLSESKIKPYKNVVFNDYMNCLWGDSDIEHLRPLIENASALGCDVFCVDAGWYNNRDVSWYGNIGDYEINSNRYGKNGLIDLINEIKKNNLIPGAWMEMEVCSDTTKVYKRSEDWFLQRNGKRVEGDERCFFNFTNNEVCEYLMNKIDTLYSLGVRFIKNDYNLSVGLGASNIDGNCASGAILNSNAFLDFIDSVKNKYDDLAIENCAGGGNRSDYKTMQHFEITSISDQIEYRKMSSIIVGSLFNILPEQLGIWCYPYPSPFERNGEAEGIIKSSQYKAKMLDCEQTVYNVVNALCGNMYVSGRVDLMDKANFEMLKAGIQVYKNMQDFIFKSIPVMLSKLNNLTNYCSFNSVGLINEARNEMLVNIFRNECKEDTIALDLFDFKDSEIEIESIFPRNVVIDYCYDKTSGKLSVKLDKMNTARSMKIYAR